MFRMTTPFACRMAAVAVVGAATLVASCGGSSGSGYGTSPPPAATAAPSGLSYSSPQTYTVNLAVTPVTPTVSGTVSSYSISPQLPAGLSLDATSGTVSGTPTAIAAQTNYTVTAANSAGSTTGTVSIAVNDVKPTLNYVSSNISLATGLTINKLVPQTTGGTITSWSVTPDLPAGLTLNTSDGSITGAPTAVSMAAAYTVSATNSGGAGTFALTIAVQKGTLLDLGHANPIKVLRFNGTQVFSMDDHGHWVLWNYSNGTNIASGDSGCTMVGDTPPGLCGPGQLADFQGSTIVIMTPAGFEIRSGADGHVVTTITVPATPTTLGWWRLATDGSYIAAGLPSAVQAWASSTGQSAFSKAGNYLNAQAFAAAGQLQLADGGAGLNVIETIAAATGTSTVSPAFQGTFQTWFADGARFLAVAGTVVNTYSSAAALQDSTAVPVSGVAIPVGVLAGTGNFWVNYVDESKLNVYQVGASTTTAASYSINEAQLTISGTTLAALPSYAASIDVIDLSGSAPVHTSAPAPVRAGTAFAATSPAQWILGNQGGVLFDGATPASSPRYLGYGAARAIAASATRFAIATASGRIVLYDTATQTVQGTIQRFSSGLQMSTDGTVLAASLDSAEDGPPPSPSISMVYSLPAASVISQWPNANLILSGSGSTVATIAGSAVTINPAAGGSAVYSGTGGVVWLSPDGTHAAIEGTNQPEGFDASAIATNLINNGSLTIGINGGYASGWLDDGHVLINNYSVMGTAPVKYTGVSIYDPTGKLLGMSSLPEIKVFQPLTADTLYSPALNSIYSVGTGTASWTTADSTLGVGAVAGNNVIFASGAQVLSLPHP
jgi:hypothetical protein